MDVDLLTPALVGMPGSALVTLTKVDGCLASLSGHVRIDRGVLDALVWPLACRSWGSGLDPGENVATIPHRANKNDPAATSTNRKSIDGPRHLQRCPKTSQAGRGVDRCPDCRGISSWLFQPETPETTMRPMTRTACGSDIDPIRVEP